MTLATWRAYKPSVRERAVACSECSVTTLWPDREGWRWRRPTSWNGGPNFEVRCRRCWESIATEKVTR